MDPAQALQRLSAGNQRFMDGSPAHLLGDPQRRAEVAEGQRPWAMVLTCADSRVPPELVFDVGLGELFVVRVAGNVASPVVVGSLELAASELECSLLVVLGHEGCGAVHATLGSGDAAQGSISELTRRIAAASPEVASMGADRADDVVRLNIVHQVEQLRTTSPLLGAAVASGNLRIVGALYALRSGEVSFLDVA